MKVSLLATPSSERMVATRLLSSNIVETLDFGDHVPDPVRIEDAGEPRYALYGSDCALQGRTRHFN